MNRPLLRATAPLVSGLVVALLAMPATAADVQAAAAPTVVTLEFDDGNADQYPVLALLNQYGLHGTFYVISGSVGNAGFLSWAQLSDLAAAGNEIGGHTISHERLTSLQPAAMRQEVCGDRVALFNHGFQPVSFAYPNGSHDDTVEQVVADCGYNSARGVSGVDGRRVFAETIPPLDPYATRVPGLVRSGTSLAIIQKYVTDAETHGGGWVQIVMHHVCDRCNPYSISMQDLTALVQWLAARSSSGTVVRTVGEVIAGPVQPPVNP
jgi:peptidoglycan/xylan/chitin deacetylase (PgdA/CDA1 family)